MNRRKLKMSLILMCCFVFILLISFPYQSDYTLKSSVALDDLSFLANNLNDYFNDDKIIIIKQNTMINYKNIDYNDPWGNKFIIAKIDNNIIILTKGKNGILNHYDNNIVNYLSFINLNIKDTNRLTNQLGDDILLINSNGWRYYIYPEMEYSTNRPLIIGILIEIFLKIYKVVRYL